MYKKIVYIFRRFNIGFLFVKIVRGAVCFVNFMILVKKILVDVERCIYETSF